MQLLTAISKFNLSPEVLSFLAEVQNKELFCVNVVTSYRPILDVCNVQHCIFSIFISINFL